MSADLNLEAERREFEATCNGFNHRRKSDGSYFVDGVESYWQGWLAARRATAGDASIQDAARLEEFMRWFISGAARHDIDPLGHVRFTTREVIIAALDAKIAAEASAESATRFRAEGGITKPEGCIKCPRDPAKTCDYCGYFAATKPATEE